MIDMKEFERAVRDNRFVFVMGIILWVLVGVMSAWFWWEHRFIRASLMSVLQYFNAFTAISSYRNLQRSKQNLETVKKIMDRKADFTWANPVEEE